MHDLYAQVQALKQYRAHKQGAVYRLVQDNGTTLTLDSIGLVGYFLNAQLSDGIAEVPGVLPKGVHARPLQSIELIAGQPPEHCGMYEEIRKGMMTPGGTFRIWETEDKRHA